MPELFTDRIFKRVKPLWDSYLTHPFVKGIGTGELSQNKFKHYMKQDYVYLIDYARLFAIGAAKSDNLDTMTLFANLLHGTMNFEMDLHRTYAAQFGITSEELEQTKPAETTTAYTSYMLQEAYKGGVEHTAISVLACAWSYHFIGQALVEKNQASVDHPFYGSWIRTYSSSEFGELAQTAINLVNRLTSGLPESKLKELEDIFIKTSYFEYLFWDMAEQELTWSCQEV